MAADGITGSDESFISFAFAIVSVLVLILYIPMLFRWCSAAVSFLWDCVMGSAKRRHRFDDDVAPSNTLRTTVDYVLYIPRIFFFLVRNPGCITSGLSVLMSNKRFALFIALPKLLKQCIRPRMLLLILWFFLLSSAMYNSLTFDAHAVLGIPADASVNDIKRAYRTLSKMYHPDQNKTEGARSLYIQVRKAYKALVDRDSFEKEQSLEDFSVGIALPRFLTSHDHDGLVLFGLLGLLFGVPLLIWYWVGSNEFERIVKLNQNIQKYEKCVEPMLTALGIPNDPRVVEKRKDREELMRVLGLLGLLPKGADETMVETLPPFAEFRNKCLDPDKYRQNFTTWGFEAEGMASLKQYFTAQNDATSSEADSPKRREEVAFVPVSNSQYTSGRFFLEQLLKEIDKWSEDINTIIHQELRAARRLQRHHAEILDLLDQLYTKKFSQRTFESLMEAPKRGDELIRDIPKELQTTFRRANEQYRQRLLAEYQAQTGKKLPRHAT